MKSPLLRSLPSMLTATLLLTLINCSDNPVDPPPPPPPTPCVVGTWGTLAIEADDVAVTPGNDPYNLLVNHGVYTFNANGSGTAVFTYGGSPVSYTWSIDGDQLIINGYAMDYTCNGDTMTTIEPSTTEGDIRHPKVETTYLKNYEPSANHSPVVTITAPSNNSSFLSGDSVLFTATATDTEDGALTGSSLVWTSDIDGQRGTGVSLKTAELSLGAHEIIVTVTDSENATGADTVTITIVNNNLPAVNITSPADNSSFQQGDMVTFTATATDAEDGALSGSSLVWTSDKDGTFGTGTTFGTTTLSINTHTITLTATDSDNNASVTSISITITTPTDDSPVVNITSPSNGATYAGGSVHFACSASDTEDGPLSGGSLVWVSDKDGQIGTGTSFYKSYLSINTHLITLTATDSDNNTTSASVTIHIEGCTPSAYIQSPADSAAFSPGESITFSGFGQECSLDSSMISGGALVWTSDLDGQIGTGTSFSSSSLSIGKHVITLAVTGNQGTVGYDSIVLFVPGGDAPTVTITSHTCITVFNPGEMISFSGEATDPEDGVLSGSSLTWSSDIDGYLGTGNSIGTSTLSEGWHWISLAAIDSDGNINKDEIGLRVAPNATGQTWEDTPGGMHFDIATSVCEAANGGFMVVGTENNTLTTGTGYDIRLIKSDNGGNRIITKSYGGSGDEYGKSILQTSDGDFLITGRTNSIGAGEHDLYLLKIDCNGEIIWEKTFGGSGSEIGNEVIETGDGNYLIVGVTTSMGNGGADVYLVKTNVDGGLIWEKSFGGVNNESGMAVCQADDGGYVLTGSYFVPSDPLGGSTDVYVLKTDINGNLVWVFNYGSEYDDVGNSIAKMSDGQYIIAGKTTTYSSSMLNPHAYLLKINDAGLSTWDNYVEGQEAYSIKAKGAGFMICGKIQQAAYSSNTDLFVMSFYSSGTKIWRTNFGGTEDEGGYSLCLASDGGYVIAGYTYSFGIFADRGSMYVVKTD